MNKKNGRPMFSRKQLIDNIFKKKTEGEGRKYGVKVTQQGNRKKKRPKSVSNSMSSKNDGEDEDGKKKLSKSRKKALAKFSHIDFRENMERIKSRIRASQKVNMLNLKLGEVLQQLKVYDTETNTEVAEIVGFSDLPLYINSNKDVPFGSVLSSTKERSQEIFDRLKSRNKSKSVVLNDLRKWFDRIYETSDEDEFVMKRNRVEEALTDYNTESMVKEFQTKTQKLENIKSGFDEAMINMRNEIRFRKNMMKRREEEQTKLLELLKDENAARVKILEQDLAKAIEKYRNIDTRNKILERMLENLQSEKEKMNSMFTTEKRKLSEKAREFEEQMVKYELESKKKDSELRKMENYTQYIVKEKEKECSMKHNIEKRKFITEEEKLQKKLKSVENELEESKKYSIIVVEENAKIRDELEEYRIGKKLGTGKVDRLLTEGDLMRYSDSGKSQKATQTPKPNIAKKIRVRQAIIDGTDKYFTSCKRSLFQGRYSASIIFDRARKILEKRIPTDYKDFLQRICIDNNISPGEYIEELKSVSEKHQRRFDRVRVEHEQKMKALMSELEKTNSTRDDIIDNASVAMFLEEDHRSKTVDDDAIRNVLIGDVMKDKERLKDSNDKLLEEYVMLKNKFFDETEKKIDTDVKLIQTDYIPDFEVIVRNENSNHSSLKKEIEESEDEESEESEVYSEEEEEIKEEKEKIENETRIITENLLPPPSKIDEDEEKEEEKKEEENVNVRSNKNSSKKRKRRKSSNKTLSPKKKKTSISSDKLFKLSQKKKTRKKKKRKKEVVVSSKVKKRVIMVDGAVQCNLMRALSNSNSRVLRSPSGIILQLGEELHDSLVGKKSKSSGKLSSAASSSGKIQHASNSKKLSIDETHEEEMFFRNLEQKLLENENMELRNRLERIKRDQDEKKSLLDTANRKYKTLESEVEELTTENEELQGELKKFEDEKLNSFVFSGMNQQAEQVYLGGFEGESTTNLLNGESSSEMKGSVSSRIIDPRKIERLLDELDFSRSSNERMINKFEELITDLMTDFPELDMVQLGDIEIDEFFLSKRNDLVSLQLKQINQQVHILYFSIVQYTQKILEEKINFETENVRLNHLLEISKKRNTDLKRTVLMLEGKTLDRRHRVLESNFDAILEGGVGGGVGGGVEENLGGYPSTVENIIAIELQKAKKLEEAKIRKNAGNPKVKRPKRRVLKKIKIENEDGEEFENSVKIEVNENENEIIEHMTVVDRRNVFQPASPSVVRDAEVVFDSDVLKDYDNEEEILKDYDNQEEQDSEIIEENEEENEEFQNNEERHTSSADIQELDTIIANSSRKISPSRMSRKGSIKRGSAKKKKRSSSGRAISSSMKEKSLSQLSARSFSSSSGKITTSSRVSSLEKKTASRDNKGISRGGVSNRSQKSQRDENRKKSSDEVDVLGSSEPLGLVGGDTNSDSIELCNSSQRLDEDLEEVVRQKVQEMNRMRKKKNKEQNSGKVRSRYLSSKSNLSRTMSKKESEHKSHIELLQSKFQDVLPYTNFSLSNFELKEPNLRKEVIMKSFGVLRKDEDFRRRKASILFHILVERAKLVDLQSEIYALKFCNQDSSNPTKIGQNVLNQLNFMKNAQEHKLARWKKNLEFVKNERNKNLGRALIALKFYVSASLEKKKKKEADASIVCISANPGVPKKIVQNRIKFPKRNIIMDERRKPISNRKKSAGLKLPPILKTPNMITQW